MGHVKFGMATAKMPAKTTESCKTWSDDWYPQGLRKEGSSHLHDAVLHSSCVFGGSQTEGQGPSFHQTTAGPDFSFPSKRRDSEELSCQGNNLLLMVL